jgi:hypothetical protein
MSFWRELVAIGADAIRGELKWRREYPADFAHELIARAELRFSLNRPGLALMALRRASRWVPRCTPAEQDGLRERIRLLTERIRS